MMMQPIQGTKPPTAETPYNQLPEQYRKEIDFCSELKDSIRQNIKSESSLKNVEKLQAIEMNLQATLKSCRTETLIIENRHDKLHKLSSNLRSDARDLSQDMRQYGMWGLQKIRNHPSGSGPGHSIERLPVGLYVDEADRLEKLLSNYSTQIQSLEKELTLSQVKVTSDSSTIQYDSSSNYGHRPGDLLKPQQVAQLIKSQYIAFLHVAGHVAESHEQTEKLKAAFREYIMPVLISKDGKKVDPFLQADKEEEDTKKMKNMIPQIDISSLNTVVQQQQQQQQSTGSMTLTTNNPSSTFTNFSNLSSTPITSSGFGFLAPNTSNASTTQPTTSFGFGTQPSQVSTSSLTNSGFGSGVTTGFGTGSSTSTGFGTGSSITPGFGAGSSTSNMFGLGGQPGATTTTTGAIQPGGGWGQQSQPIGIGFGALGGGLKSSAGELATSSGKSLPSSKKKMSGRSR